MRNNVICFFNSNKNWGGGEKWFFDTATSPHLEHFKIIVVTNSKSELNIKLKDTNIETAKFKISNFSFLCPHKILKIKKYLINKNVDSIILNLPSDVKSAGIAAKLAGIKRIIYRRGSAIAVRNSFLNRFLFKHIITEVIANSEETKKLFLKNNSNLFPSNKIHVIYNGIDLNEFDKETRNQLVSKDNNEIIFGSAGRLSKQKNYRKLIDIAKILCRSQFEFKILIAGVGELEQELKAYAKLLEVENKIQFIGFVENIRQFMNSIDIFVMTSKWEGFGYVIAEAMAAKKPVVAFNVSSNPELIINEETGFLVDCLDEYDFALWMKKLADDREMCEKMGTNARNRVEEKFDLNKNMQRIKELLEN